MLWFIIYLRFLYCYSVDTSADGLTLHEGIIIHSVVSALVYYISTFFILLLCRYLFWWTIITRGYHHTLGSECFGLLISTFLILLLCTSADGLTLHEGIIIHSVVSALVYYISTFFILLLCRYLCWWTNITRGYHHTLTLHEGIIIHSVVSALVYYISTFLILLLCRYLCWWTNITRGYHHTLGSECFGLLYIYVFYTVTLSIPLLMD